MIVEGRAVVIPGDDVDTDVMYPGSYLNVEDPEEMKQYLFDGYDPSLRDRLGPDAEVYLANAYVAAAAAVAGEIVHPGDVLTGAPA